jgi:hypothetical protein
LVNAKPLPDNSASRVAAAAQGRSTLNAFQIFLLRIRTRNSEDNGRSRKIH